MKFLCPNCKAKYQIADEKVAGRTLRMDCRRCGNNVTIRADMEAEEVDVAPAVASVPPAARTAAPVASPAKRPATSPARATGSNVGPAPTSSSPRARPIGPPSGSALGADFRRNVSMAPEAPKRTPLDQWHVAINDVPVGPMRREEITKKIASGAITGESLCWREGFDDWRPLRDVTELAALLRRPATEMPKPAAARLPGGVGARPATPAARPATASTRSSRSNVVPIGGRLGAAASLEPEFEEESEEQETEEPTRVAGFDIAHFEAELAAKEAAKSKKPEAKSESKPEAKPESKPEAKSEPKVDLLKVEPKSAERTAKKSFPPPPPEKPIELREPSRKISTPPAKEKEKEPAPLVASPEAVPATAPAAVPVVATSAFPAAVPVQAAPAPKEKERRGGGIPVGGWIAIAGAMAFGGVLAVMVGQRMLGAPPVAPAVATQVPITPTPAAPSAPIAEVVEAPPEPTQPEAVPEAVPAPEVVAAPAVTPTPTGGGGGSHARREGSTAAASAGTTAAPAAPARPTAFDRFADEASSTGPAQIATSRRPAGSEDRPTGGQDELNADQLRAVITRERPALNRCWETELRRIGQAAEVRLDVELVIGGSGTVTSVQTRGQTVGGLSECIQRNVRHWHFPPVSGQTRTSFPLIFSGS